MKTFLFVLYTLFVVVLLMRVYILECENEKLSRSLNAYRELVKEIGEKEDEDGEEL